MENDIIKKFINTDYKLLEKELEELSKKDKLRLEIDQGLDEALKDLEIISAKMPQEQTQKLFDQCTNNAMDAIMGHFGFAAVILDAKDGGNVNTTHNVRKGIYASEKERQRYANRGEYDSDYYHKDSDYIKINKEQSQLKKQGKLEDYMTGKKIEANADTDLDHIVAAKTIHDDPARVLAEMDGAKLANTESNLKMTDSSLNRSKKDKSAEEFLAKRDERLKILEEQEKKGILTPSQQKEKEKLLKQKEIQDEKFKEQYKQNEKEINREVDKKYYTSSKPYKEALITGAQDAAKMAAYSALGIVLKDFIKAIIIELKVTFKEFGNESLKEILMRFKYRICKVWEELKIKWKDILKGSFERALQTFFSNLVVFIINIFATALKSIVQIVRAGFTSLWQAMKIITNPPKDMPNEDIYYEASKIMITGLISAVTMLGSESIKNFLLIIPVFNALLFFPIPFTEQTIGDALSLCITSACGAILSTIAIFYMDKWRNDSKIGRLQIQLVAQNGVIMHYKIAQTWFVLGDAYNLFEQVVERGNKNLTMLKNNINQAKNTLKQVEKERQEIMSECINQLRNLRGE
ncbi:hypothetical protein ACT6CY_05205 [Campylobacter jejuni]|uniref:hypothetical protein n=2 Tax=Campylobacter jejuni TaxID=197 RepID=UPI000258031E|nr:hypothetical protein [Campylobacter jejuni]ASE85626.1 hypothetical protein A6J90_00195 [Campylobacter jejuni]AZU51305.1 hypothetical protein B1780_06455 [Campylobacter jejuni subsp. jejuni]EAI4437900.1 hypothetical protein [Campylobacter jejuni]EAL4062031.1 hypothetical protein [Campylobacter jejuni]ECQ5124241.1 hypothetical protein [Campylobacter jejuni]